MISTKACKKPLKIRIPSPKTMKMCAMASKELTTSDFEATLDIQLHSAIFKLQNRGKIMEIQFGDSNCTLKI